jgi:tetratricopeptide (TPR) repeat protein
MKLAMHTQPVVVTAVAAWVVSAAMLSAQTVSAPGYTASVPVNVRLTVSGKMRDGQLVGRADDKVVFTSAKGGQQVRVPVGRIDSVFFDVNPSRAEINDAVTARNWGRAGILMLPVVRTLVPYLDLPQNNGVELARDAAGYLLKSTGFRLAADTNPALDAPAVQRAKAAFALYRGLGKASWSELALVGEARAAETLLALGKRDMADVLIEKMAEPFPGDAAMGSYWMVRSHMAYADEAFADALDAAARAICFANKDIEIFPDALLMSARCYERLESYYRARDVFYEVGSLFPRTPAGHTALAHLRRIRDVGYTSEKEPAPLVNVFFGVQENMNRNVSKLLNKAPPPATE